MTFVQLYSTELDRELGSSSTTLFTVVRRKAAINAAQLEWVKRTECLQAEAAVPLVTDTQEVDLEITATDFLWIAKAGVTIKIVPASGQTRYLDGDDLTVTTPERLNAETPGWRADSAGTPMWVYTRRIGGAVFLGVHSKPDITAPDVWTAQVTYVQLPTDLVADADEPFTVSTNVLKSMRPWHRALVYYAAYDLEKFRKETGRSAAQLQLFEAEVEKFIGVQKPKGGGRVRFARNYRNRPSVAVW